LSQNIPGKLYTLGKKVLKKYPLDKKTKMALIFGMAIK